MLEVGVVGMLGSGRPTPPRTHPYFVFPTQHNLVLPSSAHQLTTKGKSASCLLFLFLSVLSPITFVSRRQLINVHGLETSSNYFNDGLVSSTGRKAVG